MPRILRPVLLFAIANLLVATASNTIADDSDFERGYRQGYSQGFNDGQRARNDLSGSSSSKPTSPPPYRGPPGIVVARAWYGDDNRSCDLTHWAVKHFNNRSSGDEAVTNQLCGDPSPGKRKSLNVEYYCKGELKTATAYEHRRISLNCY